MKIGRGGVCACVQREGRGGLELSHGRVGHEHFSDDTASDVRGDYRDLAGNGLAGHEATDEILRECHRQRSEMGVVRLALAATQGIGRLEERVKASSGNHRIWIGLEAVDRQSI